MKIIGIYPFIRYNGFSLSYGRIMLWDSGVVFWERERLMFIMK